MKRYSVSLKEVSPYVLLTIGTLGLLLNEYFFDWGRVATLIFASASVIGLLALGFTSSREKQDH
jgi:hypothetical protein